MSATDHPARAFAAFEVAERATHRAAFRLALDACSDVPSSAEDKAAFKRAFASEQYAAAVHSQAHQRREIR